MKRKLSTALVMLLAFVLLLGTTAITASAETIYEPIGGSTSFVKNLVVDADANIPNISFTYSIRRGTAIPATDSTIEILISGSGGGTIGSATFSNDDTASALPGLPEDEDHSNPTTGKKYVQKSVSITLPNTSFTKPGVYRYEISETNSNLPGVTYDSNPDRYLDVFVVANENNVLSVDNYVFRDAATTIGLNGEYTSNSDKKSSGYINALTQYDFDFSKTISGNQGDKNKRFNFTLTITGANPGTYPISANDVEGNPTSITVGADGTATGAYSLTNGSTYSGAINSSNSAKSVTLKLDSSSTLTLEGDCYVTSLENEVSDNLNINLNGHTLYVNGKAITSTSYSGSAEEAGTSVETTGADNTAEASTESESKPFTAVIISVIAVAVVLVVIAVVIILLRKRKQSQINNQ